MRVMSGHRSTAVIQAELGICQENAVDTLAVRGLKLPHGFQNRPCTGQQNVDGHHRQSRSLRLKRRGAARCRDVPAT